MSAPGDARELPVDVDPVDAPFSDESQAVFGKGFPPFFRAGHHRETSVLEVVRIGDGVCEGEADLDIRVLLLEVDDLLEALLIALQFERVVLAVPDVELREGVVDVGHGRRVGRTVPVIGAVAQRDPAGFAFGAHRGTALVGACPAGTGRVGIVDAGNRQQAQQGACEEGMDLSFHLGFWAFIGVLLSL